MAVGVLRPPAAAYGLQDHISGRTELDAGGWTRGLVEILPAGRDSRPKRAGGVIDPKTKDPMQNNTPAFVVYRWRRRRRWHSILLLCGGGDGGGDSAILHLSVVVSIICLYVCICDHIPSTNIRDASYWKLVG